jgi:signal transduction histidine kinase
MGTLIREPLLRQDYDEVEQFLLQWAEEHENILEINAVMPNKFVLVQYKRLKEGTDRYTMENRVQYLKKDLITIKATIDLKPVNSIVNTLKWQLLIGSIVVFLFFGAILWFIIKRLGIKPLENLVKERTQELLDKNKELEQIVYITSHDLRSPLVNVEGYNNIIGNATGKVISVLESGEVSAEIKNKISAIVKEDIVNSEKYISSSVSKMNALINGLLQLSRLGKIEIKKERLDMNDIIDDITSEMKYQLQQGGIKLDVSELPSCVGDRTQINQLFSNLLDNSIKFLDPKRQGIINISGNTHNNQSVYRIEDNGIGVSPEHHGKIFEIFHKLSLHMDGKGMGLSIVQIILNRHKGKILVESEKGKGSKFFIYLPAA